MRVPCVQCGGIPCPTCKDDCRECVGCRPEAWSERAICYPRKRARLCVDRAYQPCCTFLLNLKSAYMSLLKACCIHTHISPYISPIHTYHHTYHAYIHITIHITHTYISPYISRIHTYHHAYHAYIHITMHIHITTYSRKQNQIGSPSTHMRSAEAQNLPLGWSTYPYTLSCYRVQYSWKGALASVFWRGHNEFWMIWTDIAPAILFSWMWRSIVLIIDEQERTDYRLILVSLMFFGALLCRSCSLLYHTFNCVSLAANHQHIYLDLIGIASNSLGVPWVSRLAFGDPLNARFSAFFVGAYVLCTLCLFTRVLNRPVHQQMVLVALAALGNIPTICAVADASVPAAVRVLLFLGPMFFGTGYVLFYVYRIPECFLPLGSADGRWWNSHVLWHVSSALGQLAFLCTAFGDSE
jgi:hypothetical protein